MRDIVNPVKVNQPTTSTISPTIQKQSKGSRFGRIFGGIVGSALNIAVPGAGSIVGNLIGGGQRGIDFGSIENMLAHSAQQQMQMLMIQNQVQTQSQEFTTVSNLLAKRHENEMAAVRNFKS
jgi:hypothetical protein